MSTIISVQSTQSDAQIEVQQQETPREKKTIDLSRIRAEKAKSRDKPKKFGAKEVERLPAVQKQTFVSLRPKQVPTTTVHLYQTSKEDESVPIQVPVTVRRSDGYFFANDLARPTHKTLQDFFKTNICKPLLPALSESTGIPIVDLIQYVPRAEHKPDKTEKTKQKHKPAPEVWVHPVVALHLAHWCDSGMGVFVAQLRFTP
jgi:hypothetical protein